MEKQMKTKRCALMAVLIAVYVVLSMPLMVINIGGLKLTFEHFPVVLCAVLYGPVEAMLVGGIGELLNQITTFGITPTTVLWVLPIVVRGLLMGLIGKSWRKSRTLPATFFVVCMITGICASLLNTLALYVDSKLFGYYTFALVFGVLTVRILLSVLTSIVIGIATKSVLRALHHAHLI